MLGRGSLQITLNSAHLLLPHHAVASSKGNAPAWAGAAARYRTRPPSCGIGRSAPSGNAGGDSGIHDYPRAVLRPMRGRDHRAAPRGLRRAVRARAAPYTSPSSALIWSCSCSDLSSVVRCRVATRLRNRATSPAHHHAPAPEPPWLDTHEKHKSGRKRQDASTAVRSSNNSVVPPPSRLMSLAGEEHIS